MPRKQESILRTIVKIGILKAIAVASLLIVGALGLIWCLRKFTTQKEG